MKVLLDEGIPRRLVGLLRAGGMDASTLPDGWRALSDGKLLDLAEEQGFSSLVTQDQNMPFQQPLRKRRLAVLVVPQLDRRIVLSGAEAILDRLPLLEPGRYAVLGRQGSLPVDPVKPLWR